MSNTFTNVAGFQVSSPVNQDNMVDYMIEFEMGELDGERTIQLFQYLIDTGLAWKLQGFYGRTAKELIGQGYCYQALDLDRHGTYIEAEPHDVEEWSQPPLLPSGE